MERVDQTKKEIYRASLIHAAMYGKEVLNEPFYLVRFEQPEKEVDLFGEFDLEYRKDLEKLDRKFKTVLAPERAICPK